MENAYSCLINEAKDLMSTFTISYKIKNHEDDLFSSTYDELTKWVRKALSMIEQCENGGKDCELYKSIRRFRGRAGDITLKELQDIVLHLQAVN
jgi:hypothetical protein